MNEKVGRARLYSYSPRVSPPAPFIFLRVSAPESANSMSVHALLDTGADSSALPVDVVGQLGLQQVDAGFVGGINSQRVLEPIFVAFLSVGAGPPEEFEVYSFELPFAILGRDVLNKYHITLDGPNQALTITR